MLRKSFLLYVLITHCTVSAQSFGPIKTKSFYFDVDNFSLNEESMKLLKIFTDEVQNTPIEIVEIIGYIEGDEAIVYNKIKSKKRIDAIKNTIDTSVTVHQYKPLNIDYAPAFLYTYEDGFNWRRVDIIYHQILEFKNSDNDFEGDKTIANNDLFKKNIKRNSKYNSNSNKGENTIFELSDGGLGTTIKTKLDKKQSLLTKNNTSDYQQNNNYQINNDSAKSRDNKTAISENEISNTILNGIKNNLSQNNNSTASNQNTKSENSNSEVNLSGQNISNNNASEVTNNTSNQSENSNDNNSTASNQVTETEGSNGEVNLSGQNISNNNASNQSENSNQNNSTTSNQNTKSENSNSEVNSNNQKISNDNASEVTNNTSNQSENFNDKNSTASNQATKSEGLNSDVNSNNRNISNNNASEVKNNAFNQSEKQNSNTSSNQEDNIQNTLNSENQNIKEEKEINNNYKPDLEENEFGEVNIEGRSQEEIDNMVISSPSRKDSRYSKNIPSVDMSKRLSEINVDNLDKSVVLITLKIQFEGNKPITTAVSIKEMKDLFNFLYYNPAVDAFIRGHVCCGDEMALSKKRAKHVYKELIKRGISEERLRYQGFSNSLLLVNPERSEADRRMNRRVDIILSKNKNANNAPVVISQEVFDKSVEEIKTNKKVIQEVPEENKSEKILEINLFKQPIFKKERLKKLFKRKE
jgi:outer membrane protein OmpA-like peptidoglycan-associated protein